MSRRHSAEKREIIPDAKYGDIVVAKFMNTIMYEGKKSVAESDRLRRARQRRGQGQERSARRVQAGARKRRARGRGAFAPRRRRDLSGAGRSAHRSPSGAGDPLDHLAPPATATTRPWSTACRPNCSTPRTIAAQRSRSARTRTGWPKPTAPSRIIAGKRPPSTHTGSGSWRAATQSKTIAISASWRTSTPERRRRPSASSTIPASRIRSAKCTTAPRPWTGWSRSRSAASRSLPPRRPRSGRTSASTSSTRPATSTSRSRSSARLRVLDGAVCVLDGNQGVEPQTETVWRQADKYGVPRIVFVNKMDKIGADFFRCVEEINTKVGGRPICIQLPIGSEINFKGVIDLLRMKAVVWEDEGLGAKYHDEEIPADLRPKAEEYRHTLIEAAVELDDEVMARLSRRPRAGHRHAQAAASARRSSRSPSCRCCAARPSRTRACSRCSTRSSTICPRPSIAAASRASTWTPARRSFACRATPSRSRCSASRSWTTRSSARSPSAASIRARSNRARPCSTRPRTRKSASAACC